MTVKDFIARLQELDQDKNIWQIYDMCEAWEPEITHIVDSNSEYADMLAEKGVKEGDYAMLAG